MSHQKLLTKLEGFRSRNSQNHCYINIVNIKITNNVNL